MPTKRYMKKKSRTKNSKTTDNKNFYFDDIKAIEALIKPFGFNILQDIGYAGTELLVFKNPDSNVRCVCKNKNKVQDLCYAHRRFFVVTVHHLDGRFEVRELKYSKDLEILSRKHSRT